MLQYETQSLQQETETRLDPAYRVDLRDFTEKEYNKFVKLNSVNDWSQLSWKDVGKPYKVNSFAREKTEWDWIF